MGVINGIILQETFKVAATDDTIMVRQHQRSAAKLRNKMMDLLTALDFNQDQKLTLDEFSSVAEEPEIKAWLAALAIETDDLPTLFSLLDLDDNGEVTIEEFIT